MTGSFAPPTNVESGVRNGRWAQALRARFRIPHALATASPATHDVLIGRLVVAGAIAHRGHAPRRLRLAADRGLALATAVRVVARVHHRAAHGRALAEVAI